MATKAVPRSPVVIDIACGDARVLLETSRRAPDAHCFGVDLHVGAFAPHSDALALGVELRRVLIQDLFAEPAPVPVDFAVMLNTYRGWDSADLRDDEADLPSLADGWFDASARFTLLTMRADQIEDWRTRGYRHLDLGRGEDESRMVILTREPVGASLRARAGLIRARAAAPRLRRR